MIAERVSKPTGHFDDAVKELSLTPQEQYLYQHHLKNLTGPGHIVQPGGEVSTMLQANTQGPDGRYYNIPTVWYGQQLPMPLARLMAAQIGWDKWPAYPDAGEAERRYNDMHQYMTRDLALIGQ